MAEVVDAVVIGGGILGAATARSLSRHGLRVTILEAGVVNGQGSGATAGNLHVQALHSRRPGQSTPVDVGRLVPLQRAASAGWERWAAELPQALGLRRCGGIMVAETPQQLADLQRKRDWEQAAEIPTEVIDRRRAEQLVPGLGPGVIAATWCAWDGFADPSMVTPALLAAAARAGTTVVENAPVDGLKTAGDGWTVTAGNQDYACGQVVNVAGPWLREVCALAGTQLDLTPVAIQMYSTDPVPPVLGHLLQHVAEGLSIKQTGDRRVMVGGGWPAGPMRPNGTADLRPTSTEGSRSQVRRVLPALATLPAARVWAGPLAATPDEMPVIGEVPGCPGLFVAGGTYAFTFAPLWADILTAMMTGGPHQSGVADLGPERLISGPRSPQ